MGSVRYLPYALPGFMVRVVVMVGGGGGRGLACSSVVNFVTVSHGDANISVAKQARNKPWTLVFIIHLLYCKESQVIKQT